MYLEFKEYKISWLAAADPIIEIADFLMQFFSNLII